MGLDGSSCVMFPVLHQNMPKMVTLFFTHGAQSNHTGRMHFVEVRQNSLRNLFS